MKDDITSGAGHEILVHESLGVGVVGLKGDIGCAIGVFAETDDENTQEVLYTSLLGAKALICDLQRFIEKAEQRLDTRRSSED